MLKKYILPLTTVVFTAIGASVYAEEPANISYGGIDIFPSFLIGYGYDDNVWGTPGETVSSNVMTILPRIVLRADRGLNIYQLSYSLFGEYFDDSDKDNHTDHLFRFDSHLDINDRNRLDLLASYTKAKARRDTTNNFFGESGNETQESKVGGIYGFGALSGKGQLDLTADYVWLRYDNNYKTGSENYLRERNIAGLIATTYYRVAPKTRALFELRYKDFDYLSSGNLLNSDNYSALVGAAWYLTAKTTGTVKLGYSKKEFDDSSMSDFDDGKFVWNIKATWLPRTYSTVTLESGSFYGEGSITEALIDTTQTSIDWRHSWSYRWNTTAKYSYISDDYDGSINNGRKDKIDELNLGINYRVQSLRGMEVGAYYTYRDNDSNQTISDWKRKVYGVNVNFNL